MGLLRSETMKHGMLVLPVDRARYFLDLVGKHVKIQFEDMNSRDMQRPYRKFIQRIDEMERMLRFLLEEISKVPGATVTKNHIDSFLDHADYYKLDEVEGRLKGIHNEFVRFKENNVTIIARHNEALEERYVVQTAIAAITHATMAASRGTAAGDQDQQDGFDVSASQSLRDHEVGRDASRTLEAMFSNIAGVIAQDQQYRFARTLFRATRGNAFTHFQQIPEPMQDSKIGHKVLKSVFVIYFQDHRVGSAASAMSQRVNKICTSYGVKTYHWPANRQAAEDRHVHLHMQVEDQQRLLTAQHNFMLSEAASLLTPAASGRNSPIEEWRLFCMKEKAIYATLNLFEGDMNLRASCWYLATEEDQIRALLIQHSESQYGHSSAMLVSDSDRLSLQRQPPTYIKVNEFTAIFQELVDTYGLPRYQEANPALFTVVTFPFLFGVMYGDIGHGLMLLMIGVYAVWKCDELKFTFPELHAGRYILLMMGIFTIYCGLLYNDFFSIGLDLFGTRWSAIPEHGQGQPEQVIALQPLFDTKNEAGPGPYPFGIDPAWHGSQNELVYLNSMKMKLSVIVGVAQMVVGLLLRVSNALYMRNVVDLFCECIPMMIFLVCFFGFMDYMILYKWVTPLNDPPSIINSMIAMAMWQEDANPMFGTSLPRLLMAVSMLAVPFMLIPKPLILRMQHKARHREQYSEHLGLVGPSAASSSTAVVNNTARHLRMGDEEEQRCRDEDEEQEFDFTEIAIHQVIETIEFVLGTVSHTASYLRLWALSLAHQQLSLVFFSMTLVSGMSAAFPFNIMATYLAFAFWFGATVAILLGMDVMECFLHTLRLHWVEFQSKFYKADGYAFVPFCHREILQRSIEDK